ncbi:hypothetical protein [Kytococcus sedentarius]|uniref:hypothetical protein n=1 Tax=Kytococcus sedentarius TaxID=1276 RepID=UPI00194FCF1D|nr:hypothetical protein [Kytococcus sedentarius]QRO87838.1 hypothetical protein I6J30_02360 [Kytococcus sedentarius]
MRPAIRPVPTGAGDVDLSVLAARVAVAPEMATIAAVAGGAGRTGRGGVDVTTALDVCATTAAEAVGVVIALQGGAVTTVPEAVGAVLGPAEERVTVPTPSQGAPAHWHRRKGVDPNRPSLMV